MGALQGCRTVKFYSSSNLLSSVHTVLLMILRSVSFNIKTKIITYYLEDIINDQRKIDAYCISVHPFKKCIVNYRSIMFYSAQGRQSPYVNDAHCILIPYFHKIYKFPPIFAKLINFPYFR